MSAKKAEENIWNQVNVDLWGPPATINKNGQQSMHLMTMIDPVSWGFEVELKVLLKDCFEVIEVEVELNHFIANARIVKES